MLCELGRTKTGSAMIGRMQAAVAAYSHKNFKRFLANTAGNTSMVFMMTLVPSAAFVGMMTDYGRSFVVKQQITTALDAAALVGGRTFDQTGDMAKSTKAAQVYFGKILPKNIHASLTSVKADSKGNVTMSASSSIKPLFLPLIGITNIALQSAVKSLAADKTPTLSAKSVELAVVMDVTDTAGLNSRLANAKTAVNNMIDTLLPASGVSANKVRISIVPFSQYINTGAFTAAVTNYVPPAPVVTNGTPITTTVCTTPTPTLATPANCVSWAGYDPVTGRDQAGYTKNGFDTNTHNSNPSPRDREGCDQHGRGDDGYDRDGWDKHGYDRNGNYEGQHGDGYGNDDGHHDGHGDDNGGQWSGHHGDDDGNNSNNYTCEKQSSDNDHSDDRDNEHYDANGYDAHGFDHDGFDKSGTDPDGHGHSGCDHEGYDHDGYKLASDGKLRDHEGYDKDGYEPDHQSVDRDRDGFDRDGYRFDAQANNYGGDNHQCGRSQNTSSNDYDEHGCDRSGKDRWGVPQAVGVSPKAAGITCAKFTTPNNVAPCTSVTVVPQPVVPTPTFLLPCVIERTVASTHAYDDASPTDPSGAFTPITSTVNRTTCPPATPVTPLTNNAATLKAAVAAMISGGKSAGHLGAAWGMYTVSPNWANFWGAQAGVGAKPAAVSANVVKIVLIVTDGGLNWHYNADTTPVDEAALGATTAQTKGNGLASSQANQICTYMKSTAMGVEVFTVGVDLGTDTSTLANLQACASPATPLFSQHFYNVPSSASTTTGLVPTLSTLGTSIAVATGTGNQVLRFTQ